MKKQHRNLLIRISSVIIVVIIYLLFFRSSVKISKIVKLDSYKATFDKELIHITNKPFNSLSENEKEKHLATFITNNDFRIRAYSCRLIAKLENKEKALLLFANSLNEENPVVLDETIVALKELNLASSTDLLKNLIKKLSKYIDHSIPFSSIGEINVWGLPANKKINLRFQEKDQADVKLDDEEVYEITELFPDDPDWFLYFPNFDDNFKKFIKSDFVEEIQKMEIYNDISKAPLVGKYYQIKNILSEKFGNVASLIDPEDIFEDNLSVAKYDEEYLGVTFAGSNSKLFDLISNSSNLSSKTFKINHFNYNNIKYTELTIQNSLIYFANLNEYLILSTNKLLLEKSLATFTEKKYSSLAADPSFNFYYKLLDHYGKKNYFYLYSKPNRLFGLKGEADYSAYLARKALQVLEKITNKKYELSNGEIVERSKNEKSDYDLTTNDLMSLKINNVSYPEFWKYITDVRSLSESATDSLLRMISINPTKDLFDKLGDNFTLSYQGIDYSPSAYNYTALKSVMAIPVKNAVELEKTMITLFKGLFQKAPNKGTHNDLTYYTYYDTTVSSYSYHDPLPRTFVIYNNYLFLSQKKELIFDKINLMNDQKKTETKEDTLLSIDIKPKETLINFYKYLVKYGYYSSKMKEREIDRNIKPFFKHLSKISNISLKAFENKGLLKGNLSITLPD